MSATNIAINNVENQQTIRCHEMSMTANVQGMKSLGIVPYYGRMALLPMNEAVRVNTISRIVSILDNIEKTDIMDKLKDSKAPWKRLKEDLVKISRNLSNPEYGIEEYKLEIFREGILPYIEDLNRKLFVDADRFDQIKMLLDLLNHCAPPYAENPSVQHHPGEILLQADKLLAGVKSGFWKSEFQQMLKSSLNKQWSPIVADNQRALRSIGGKMLVLGIAEIVGRPILMLYPLYLVVSNALQISNEINTRKTFSPHHIIEISKALLLLWGSVQLLSILGAYTGLGYSCLILGIAAVFISSSDSLTKTTAPALSPHFVRIDTMIQKFSAVEQQLLNAVSAIGSGPSRIPPAVNRANNDAISAAATAAVGITTTNAKAILPNASSALQDNVASAPILAAQAANFVVGVVQSMAEDNDDVAKANHSASQEPPPDDNDDDYVIPTNEELEDIAQYQSPPGGLRKRKVD